MATAIADSWVVSSDVNTFLGVTKHKFDDSVILTDLRTATVYKVSDQHNTFSFTLKSDAKFRFPVVFDWEEEKFVAIVDQLDKTRLCIWEESCTDYKDWKKKHLLTPVSAIVEVNGSEPLMVKADKTICWLSQFEDPSLAVPLLPEGVNEKHIELRKFSVYKHGARTDLTYHMDTEGMSAAYLIQYNSKQAMGQPVALFAQTNVDVICRCPGTTESPYIAVSPDDHSLLLSRTAKEDVETLYTLDSGLSVRHLNFLQDSDQLLITANDLPKNHGKLLVYSLKYRTVRELKELDSNFCGEAPVIQLPNHILALTESSVSVQAYRFVRLTLRSMMTSSSTSSGKPEEKEIASCMEHLESVAKEGKCTGKTLVEYDKKKLLHALQAYSRVDCQRWTSCVIESLLEYLTIPSHVLTLVAEAAVRHADTHVAEYMVYKIGELPESAVVVLLDYFLKGIPAEEDAMETDVVGDPIPDVKIASTIDTLLNREITDVYASEALRKLEFNQVLVLLRYLISLLSSDAEGQNRRPFDDGHIGRWCSVLLDAHYLQIILSDHAHLLVQLHENARQQVELSSSLMKLKANLFSKLPVKKPSQGPYCIEAVTLHY
ncbi:nucleolar protein 11-like [Watersipora subatra]|uniref:nucleolar protein 11-like n=1 Tax=Watersipora subatra TaxID=2589382 RepID=UPI00355B2CBD